jgi:sulfite exporter TauE/SafE
MPAMMIMGIAANKINRSFQQRINAYIPYVLTIVGLLVCLRGMNLNIPYISPAIKMAKKSEVAKECKKPQKEVQMDCCHR